jgi:hypothetical protein
VPRLRVPDGERQDLRVTHAPTNSGRRSEIQCTRPRARDRLAAQHRRDLDDGLDECEVARGDACNRAGLLLVAIASVALAKRREVGASPAPHRMSARLRRRRAFPPRGAAGTGLPYRSAELFLPIVISGAGREVGCVERGRSIVMYSSLVTRLALALAASALCWMLALWAIYS